MVRRQQDNSEGFWGLCSVWRLDPEGSGKGNFSDISKVCYLSPGQIAQLVRTLSQYTKVAGSIPGWGIYKNQPMGPGWCGSGGWSIVPQTKRLWVRFSGHMPRFQAQSPGGTRRGRN